MSAHDNRTLRLAAGIEHLVATARREEARRLERERKAEQVDARIMAACKAVGQAADKLAQAQFSGVAEYPARMALERAAKHLAGVLRSHGRMKGDAA